MTLTTTTRGNSRNVVTSLALSSTYTTNKKGDGRRLWRCPGQAVSFQNIMATTSRTSGRKKNNHKDLKDVLFQYCPNMGSMMTTTTTTTTRTCQVHSGLVWHLSNQGDPLLNSKTSPRLIRHQPTSVFLNDKGNLGPPQQYVVILQPICPKRPKMPVSSKGSV